MKIYLIKNRLGINYLNRLLFLFITFFFFQTQLSQAQQVSLSNSRLTLRTAFTEIERQTDMSVDYNREVIDVNKIISIPRKEGSLSEIMTALLQGTGCTYVVRDNHIVISKAPITPQQTRKNISGTITDQQGEPIIGANIVEKGTTNGTVTDIDGKYTLNVENNAVLLISYIGYLTQEVSTIGRSIVSSVLQEDTKTLEELVVVGYGTMRKKDLTGAISSVEGDVITNRKTTQLSTSLQGALAGVTINRSSGAPAASSSIQIRGITTIGDTSPLIIVDGMPVNDIDFVNPKDVENIIVLKDAASASIYGSRAASGVLLITTKRAQDNKLSLGYTFEYGIEKPTRLPEFVSPTRFMQMENELRWNDAGNGANEYPTYAKDLIEDYYTLNAQDPDKYPITDWYDLVLNSGAPRQSHLLDISGGTKNARTRASLAYEKTDGLYTNRFNERYTLRVNNDFIVNDVIGATLDVNYRRAHSKQPSDDPFSAAEAISIIPSIWAGLWSDGRYGPARPYGNIYAMVEEGGYRDYLRDNLGGKISVDITPFDGLKLSAIFSPTLNFSKDKSFRRRIQIYDAKDPTLALGDVSGHNTTSLSEERNDNYTLTGQFIANYIKSFGEHSLNLMTGYETFYAFNENLLAGRNNYTLDSYPYLDLGPLDYRTNSGNATELAYQSYFGRIMYSYAQRYMVQLNMRRDGSSRFDKNYRWGTFPSLSLGWVLSEESFMESTRNFLSYLKVRASWGILGNERIGNYPYQSSIGFTNILFNSGGKVISSQAAAQSNYAIRDITWETTESMNIGLDAAFLSNRLRVTADYYKKTTRDMLLALEIPKYVGYSNPEKNTGKMFTNGFELEIGWNDRIGEINYSASVNLSDFVSKMGDLGGTEFLGDQIKKEGSQFNEWYGYLSDGIYQTQEEVDNSAKLNANIKPGDIRYKDISGPDGLPDGKISPEYDRVLLGGSLPRYIYGGNIQLDYKGIDVSFAFQGIGSRKVRMTTEMIQPLRANWGNIPKILDDNYWSKYNTEEENENVKYPRLTYTNAGSNYTMSDFWLFNGRYLRLKNITVGYTIPEFMVEKAKIANLRIYVSANDLFSLDSYPKGRDPETGVSAYPIMKSFLVGLSVNF